jgi:hypothetical protein
MGTVGKEGSEVMVALVEFLSDVSIEASYVAWEAATNNETEGVKEGMVIFGITVGKVELAEMVMLAEMLAGGKAVGPSIDVVFNEIDGGNISIALI